MVDYPLRVTNLKQKFSKIIKSSLQQGSRRGNLIAMISERVYEIYFVLVWSEQILFGVKASECLLLGIELFWVSRSPKFPVSHFLNSRFRILVLDFGFQFLFRILVPILDSGSGFWIPVPIHIPGFPDAQNSLTKARSLPLHCSISANTCVECWTKKKIFEA